MIIYGTGNFNRRNQTVVRCTCPNCGRRDYHRSYTSSRFFTLYFVPVIPIGRQKILQECQHCDNAYGLSLGDYKSKLKHDLPRAIGNFQEDPSDADRAQELISTIVITQSLETMREFGPQIAACFDRNAEVLHALADACSYLCLDEMADEFFLSAVNTDDSEELAKSAEAHMQHKNETKPSPPNRILQSLPILILPAILLFVFGNYFQKAVSNRPEHIYLINGLDQSYELFINDRPITLRAKSKVEARHLTYGENSIRPAAGSLPIETQTITIGEGDVSQKAFGDLVYVVNPDQAAILTWERAVYSANPELNDDFAYKVHTGKTLHTFSKINYLFREFPEEISLPSATSRVSKTRLYHVRDEDKADLLSALISDGKEDEVESFLRAALRFESENSLLIRMGQHFLPNAEFEELAQAHMEARPVEVEWHRSYQNTRQEDSIQQLEQHYQTLYEAEPDNNQIAYLYARILSDPTRSMEILKRAADSSLPSGYASYGLSYHYMLDGEYERALQYADKALTWLPLGGGFDHTRKVSLWALGEYEEISSECETILSAGFDFQALYDWVYAQSKLGHSFTAIERIEKELEHWKTENYATDEDVSAARSYFDTALSLSAGNKSGLIKVVRRDTSPYSQFQDFILGNDPQAAGAIATANPELFDFEDHLLIFILARKAGKTALSKAHLEIATSELAKQNSDMQTWAKWLGGEPVPDFMTVVHTCPNIAQQQLLLAALGASLDEKGVSYLQHVNKLIYQETFYTMALRDVLSI